MPDVSSYTWTTVFSPRIWMTSPMSCSVPTSTTSYMRGFSPIAVTTGPATRWIVPLPLISVVTFALAATLPTSLEQVHADRSLHLRPQVFVLCRADRNHDRPRDGLEPASHRVAQALHVRGIQDQDAHLGIVEDRRDDLLDFPEQGPDPGRLDALEVARDFRVKGILAQAGHEGGLVKPDHLVQFVLRRLVPAREEDLAIERRLGRPDPEERLQIDEVDLALDEFPHESIRFRRWRDGLKEVGVVEPGHPVLPGGPLGDSRRALAQSRQGLRVDGSLESLEHLIEVRRLDELPEEFDRETAGGHEVFLDFFG